MARKHLIGVTPFKQYPTYQGVYELHPQNGLSVDRLYVKAVLRTVDYLRDRVSDKGGDISPLAPYPAADQYETFPQEEFEDLGPLSAYDIKIVSWNTQSTWAVRIIEPGNESNETFHTVITLKKADDTVVLAARTFCRAPINAKPTKVFRPRVISHALMEDPDIIMTEYGVGTDYPMFKDLIFINGKGNVECDTLCSELLFNSNRQYPVLILTKGMADALLAFQDLNGSTAMNNMLEAGKCVAYFIVVENSHQKLIRIKLEQEQLADAMDTGRTLAVFSDDANGCEAKAFTIFDDEGGLLWPDFNGLCDHLQHNTRNRQFDYHDVDFYSDARQKKLLETLPRTEDPEQSAAIAEIINGYQEELDAKTQTENLLLGQIADLEKSNQKLQENNTTLSRANRKLEGLQLKLDDSKVSAATADAKITALEEQLAKAHEDNAAFAERAKALLNIPLRDDRQTRERLLAWIQDNYGDRIVLHEKAKSSFLADDKTRDLNFFCRLMHYLYGYTKCMAENPGKPTAASEAAKAYDLLGENIKVEDSGKWSVNHYKDYEFDISDVNPNKGVEKMDKHFKIGKGMDGYSVRIYFYYDSETGKSILGHLYGHLEIGMK